MDASAYGRLVERGGYATGGIVQEPVAWLMPEDPPAFVYPALGVTRDHLIGPPYYAAMWDVRRARAVEAAEDGARRVQRTEALNAFDRIADVWSEAWREAFDLACQIGKVTWVEPSGAEGYVPPRAT